MCRFRKQAALNRWLRCVSFGYITIRSNHRLKQCSRYRAEGYSSKDRAFDPNCFLCKEQEGMDPRHRQRQQLPWIKKSPQSKSQMRFIQINLNHFQSTEDLLSQTIYKKKIDVAIISEPYRNQGDGIWFKDQTRTRRMDSSEQKVKRIHIYSCYDQPSATFSVCEQMLSALWT